MHISSGPGLVQHAPRSLDDRHIDHLPVERERACAAGLVRFKRLDDLPGVRDGILRRRECGLHRLDLVGVDDLLSRIAEPSAKFRFRADHIQILEVNRDDVNRLQIIRGAGSDDLSWDKGIQLRNVGPDTWIYETDKDFDALEFKVLVDDKRWEDGSNHQLARGKTSEYKPKFK